MTAASKHSMQCAEGRHPSSEDFYPKAVQHTSRKGINTHILIASKYGIHFHMHKYDSDSPTNQPLQPSPTLPLKANRIEILEPEGRMGGEHSLFNSSPHLDRTEKKIQKLLRTLEVLPLV